MTARATALAFGAMLFVIAATANSGGYRYGVSDQAFYATAVVKDLHPSFYPRDGRLLDVESHLMWADEIVGGLVRVAGVDQPPVYLALYLATLVLLFTGAVAFGRAAGLSWWAIGMFLVLLTFRHRIAKTGANSLEGYMHPRMLAFAIGVLGLAALVSRRHLLAATAVLLAGCWHPTTALWFGIVAGIAIIIDRPEWRRWTGPAAGAGMLAALWIVLRGPLAERMVIMDPAWLAVLAEKDYLFPHEWPLYAWLANLTAPAVVFALFRRRAALGRAVPGEGALVAGLLSLAAIFFITLPLTMLRVALAVQLQITRVFWLLDFAMAAYLAWWLMDDWLAARRTLKQATVGLLLAASVIRGGYLLSLDRHLFSSTLPASPWIEAMSWLRTQPSSWYVLADPGHAWRYGVSVRLAAEKDVLLETGKDTALAIYDRDIAMTIADRQIGVGDFAQMTSADASRLAGKYHLDVAVVEAAHPLEFPELYRNREFVVYKLR